MQKHDDETALDLSFISTMDDDDITALGPEFADFESDLGELGELVEKRKALLKGSAVGREVLSRWAKANRRRLNIRNLVRRLNRRTGHRKRACTAYALPRRAKLTAKDIAGRVQTPTPLYAKLSFKAGALSGSIQGMSGQNVRMVKAFHKGVDDDGAPYGVAVPIDRHRTNMITGGALPDGSTFIGYGIDIDIQAADRSEATAADLRIIGDALVRWGDRNGSNMVTMARVSECPPTSGIISASGGGDELGTRFTGKAFRSPTPLFTLKGGEKGHEMQIEFPDPALELTKAYDVLIKLKGKHYQRPTGT